MQEIVDIMERLASREGANETAVNGVHLFRRSENIHRTPLLYKQGVIIMGQGAKKVHLGNQVYEYDQDHYLVLTVPLPAECEAEVVDGKPLLSLMVDIDMRILNSVIQQMDDWDESSYSVSENKCPGLYRSQATQEFKETVLRLLRTLESPVKSRVLGEGLVRELLFRILCGENAASLHALALKNTGLSRIDKALKQIHSNFDQPFQVDQLAGFVNMSTSAFHRSFKGVTSLSPIQYLKKVRLNRAKSLIVEEGVRSGDAARMVGYESVSQFNREFKRYFGASPRGLLMMNSRTA